MLTAADVTNRDGAVRRISRCCDATDYLDLLKKIMDNGGYTGENFAQAVKSACGAEAEVIKRNGLHTFVVLPKRWIVERTFGWLDKCRRLWKKRERLLHNSLQMISLPLPVRSWRDTKQALRMTRGTASIPFNSRQ